MTEEKRDLIVQRAMKFMRDQPRYHVIYHNCEHTTNLITMKTHKKSDLVDYVFSNARRHLFHFILCIFNIVFDWIGLDMMSQPIAFTHVFAIQISMLRSCIQSERTYGKDHQLLWESMRFVFVSILAYFSIIYLVSFQSMALPLLAVPNIFWFCDTIVFNTVLNAYAVFMFRRSSKILDI